MAFRMHRRAAISAAATLLAGAPALAQSRPIRFVVPYGAGSGPDLFARQFAQGFSTRIDAPVVVDNRGGATTIIGAEFVASAPPDGQTLFMGTSTTFLTNPFLFRRLPYALAQFQPISLLIRTRLALYANVDLPANDVAGVVALAKAARAPMHYGITGRGNSTHLTGEALQIAAGITLMDVPYRGTGPMQQGIVRNDLPLAIDGIPAWLSLAAERRVKVIAVTGDSRVGALPQVPTFTEAGLSDLGRQHWYGLFGPAGMPAPLLARLNAAAIDTMRDVALWQNLVHEGGVIETNSPDAFATMIEEEKEMWGAIIRRVGITLE
ncbi:tripartite tricarboxylate transporter substrate binding protein [Roseomonas terrae]|uniref:Tripartite tricarboxylate transporter substrate binding protein n=1 Tax=Neoroseomonas terrae TaxID=424799 RepID=A0ABS5EGI7_9PROT|nr:tripartite tricarboxylate transporter substrate binding protein [Neoroseomonas terrae]MBR0650136.1 tripartite tricarboxylate transporter substrate binding protein [Neoroseomonas terrae]